MQAAGRTVSGHLCEHFPHTRTELFAIVKAKKLTTFDDVIAQCGTGQGCEICKPAITSMLASLWNEHIMRPKHQTLQDTNDRFLANMQRGGLYSASQRTEPVRFLRIQAARIGISSSCCNMPILAKA